MPFSSIPDTTPRFNWVQAQIEMRLGRKVMQDWWDPFLPGRYCFYDREQNKIMVHVDGLAFEFAPTKGARDGCDWVIYDDRQIEGSEQAKPAGDPGGQD